jgi:hypothetical protein
MLYSGGMSEKLNVPDEIFLGEKEYSWRADWRVNGWLFAATIVSGACDVVFPHAIGLMPVGVRVGIALAEFLAILLWARCLAKWIRGMDELHRRITTSAVLFAVSATFFLLMLWHRLDAAGIFNAISGRPKAGGGWDICTVGHGFLLLTLFYFGGHSFFNRRYK